MKMICRKCYARLPPRSTNCRKKKCGHSNKHQSSIIAPILAAFSASFARRGMLSTNPPMACLASLAHF
uniref:Large ribosomal subunit protein eL40 domain-containing protein n=1 Tax=Oryza meridionalis TaxID=40149 RepID=A0A0E0EBD3_9ORYZ